MKLKELFTKRETIADDVIEPNLVKAEIYRQGYSSIMAFSLAVGINYSTLYCKIVGKRVWSLPDARKVAKKLKLPIETLFYGEDIYDHHKRA